MTKSRRKQTRRKQTRRKQTRRKQTRRKQTRRNRKISGGGGGRSLRNVWSQCKGDYLKRDYKARTYEDQISLAECKELEYRKYAYLAKYPAELKGKKTRDILKYGNEREEENDKADFTSGNHAEFTGNYAYTKKADERERERFMSEWRKKGEEADARIKREEEEEERMYRESHPDEDDDGPAPQEER